MLVLTALVILFRPRLENQGLNRQMVPKKNADAVVLFAGIFLGIFVTLSSVGAGAFGAAVLMVLYPHLKAIKIVGTDISHAVPLTLIAGLGHLFILGNVDFLLLFSLLVGSLPAIHLGTKLATRIPGNLLQTGIALLLLGMGVKFALF
jgi:uncharacterized membrane protein YfcA